jgi:hypothetical protein
MANLCHALLLLSQECEQAGAAVLAAPVNEIENEDRLQQA